MTKKIYTGLLFTALTLFHSSCLEQTTEKYSTYESADEAMLFERGWFPQNFVFKSMSNIYLRNQVDDPIFIFSYNLSEADIKKMKTRVESTAAEHTKPSGIWTPNWWEEEVTDLPYYELIGRDIGVYIAIDNQNNKISGWSKY